MIKPLPLAVCTLCFLIIHYRSQLPENRLDMIKAVDYLKVDQAGRRGFKGMVMKMCSLHQKAIYQFIVSLPEEMTF